MAVDLSSSPGADLPFVRLERVSKKYGAFRLALSDVSLGVARSEFVHVVGPSGSGKSTLIRLAGALEAPTSGSVRIGGEDPVRMRPRALAFLRRSIGVVMQEPALLDERSVLENVMLPAIVSSQTRREALKRARAALGRLEFTEIDALPGELSVGARQRVALARAIVNRPALLLVDDPVARLDAAATQAMLQLLEQFAISGVAVLLTSQYESEYLPRRARLVRLDHGVIRP